MPFIRSASSSHPTLLFQHKCQEIELAAAQPYLKGACLQPCSSTSSLPQRLRSCAAVDSYAMVFIRAVHQLRASALLPAPAARPHTIGVSLTRGPVGRTQPTCHGQMRVDILHAPALLPALLCRVQFEVARCRPQLTAEFFKQLDTLVGQERFSPKPDEDRLAELDTLRQYLEEAVEAVDKAVASNISAVERMRTLLSSPDKKQCISDMAAANEIDVALIDLLQQNIEAAKGAGQDDAAAFMEKVKNAAAKFLVTGA
eukprot:GHRQ01013562.1.p1 GENE.GHRQ01013562.1~~GHRQ01013562.1.p1  ORF type:complete len:257 (+),score=93.25 GHRQ01013562.1:702-1472(+)